MVPSRSQDQWHSAGDAFLGTIPSMAVRIEPVIDDLYREIIIDHYRNPRHRGPVEDATSRSEGTNPICGDEVSLSWRCQNQNINAIGFEGQGCSICMASASMMCDAVADRSVEDAKTLANSFRDMLLRGGSGEQLGDLESLAGVAAYPVRIKCAVLPWNALLQGLGEKPDAN